MSIVYNKLGVLYKDQGDNEKALFYYKAAKEYSDEASGSASPEALRSSFIDNLKIGEALEAQGKLDDALESYQKIYPIAKELRKMAPSDQSERDYFIALIKLGDIAYKKKNNDDAYVYYDEARVISEKLKEKNPGRQAEYDYMYTMQQLGFVKKGKKKWFAFWK